MALKLMNVTKSFADKIILSSFSCEFPEKGVVAVIGESGVGKTTLLRMIAGLDKNYSGEIISGGIGKVSFAFQEHRLFPTVSALDNLVLVSFKKSDAEKVKICENMLISLGFTKDDTRLFPSELSGGMKQRVSLARAFLKDSPILLLDEPTKELDKENAELVLNEIEKEGKKRLVILVTHRTEELQRLSASVIDLGAERNDL